MLPLLVQGMYEHVEYKRNGSRRSIPNDQPAMHVSVREIVKVIAVCPREIWTKSRMG